MLLQEFNPVFKLTVISEGRGGNSKTCLRGKFQEANQLNKNNRIYSKELLERETTKLQGLIDENRLVGELDHPTYDVVKLQNASHRITGLSWEGNDLIGEMELLSTPAGKVAECLLKDGVQLGISSRALGSLSPCDENEGASKVNDDLDMRTYDLVADPSVKGAFPGLTEGVQAERKIKNAYKQVLGEKVFVSMLKESLQSLVEQRSEMDEGIKDAAKAAVRGVKKTVRPAALATAACIGPACTDKKPELTHAQLTSNMQKLSQTAASQHDKLRRNRIGRTLRPGTNPEQQGGPYSSGLKPSTTRKDSPAVQQHQKSMQNVDKFRKDAGMDALSDEERMKAGFDATKTPTQRAADSFNKIKKRNLPTPKTTIKKENSSVDYRTTDDVRKSISEMESSEMTTDNARDLMEAYSKKKVSEARGREKQKREKWKQDQQKQSDTESVDTPVNTTAFDTFSKSVNPRRFERDAAAAVANKEKEDKQKILKDVHRSSKETVDAVNKAKERRAVVDAKRDARNARRRGPSKTGGSDETQRPDRRSHPRGDPKSDKFRLAKSGALGFLGVQALQRGLSGARGLVGREDPRNKLAASVSYRSTDDIRNTLSEARTRRPILK
tara:strand:- start:1508 stop:3343 length:1836 start_codon:yes stop_codon:yes gene_type:complete